MKVFIVVKETETGKAVHGFLTEEEGREKWRELVDAEGTLIEDESVVGQLAFASNGMNSINLVGIDL